MNANMSKWKAPFIYLGSASPRRRELLTQFGVPFEVVKSSYEETHEAWTDPVQYCYDTGSREGAQRHITSGDT